MNQHICPTCHGDGRELCRAAVTHDMASDAGCPQMEGDVIDWEVICPECGGCGYVEDEQ